MPPIDAQLEDTAEAFKALPWFHKAAIGDGEPYSYHSAVRDLGDLELDEIGGLVIEDSSDAVWIISVISARRCCPCVISPTAGLACVQHARIPCQ